MEESSHHVWERGVVRPLGKHFNSREFTCKCTNKDCLEQKVSKDIIDRLDKIREELNRPIKITSAFRCKKHQDSLRGSGIKTATGTSTHELGEAVDARPLDLNMEGFEEICQKHFTSIGISDRFLHLDTRKDYRRWKY